MKDKKYFILLTGLYTCTKVILVEEDSLNLFENAGFLLYQRDANIDDFISYYKKEIDTYTNFKYTPIISETICGFPCLSYISYLSDYNLGEFCLIGKYYESFYYYGDCNSIIPLVTNGYHWNVVFGSEYEVKNHLTLLVNSECMRGQYKLSIPKPVFFDTGFVYAVKMILSEGENEHL